MRVLCFWFLASPPQEPFALFELGLDLGTIGGSAAQGSRGREGPEKHREEAPPGDPGWSSAVEAGHTGYPRRRGSRPPARALDRLRVCLDPSRHRSRVVL